MQDDIEALFAYDRWANRRVLDACRKLTAEQYAAPNRKSDRVEEKVVHLESSPAERHRSPAAAAGETLNREKPKCRRCQVRRLVRRVSRLTTPASPPGTTCGHRGPGASGRRVVCGIP